MPDSVDKPPNRKRTRAGNKSDDSGSDDFNNNVEMLLLELSKKMDGLSTQMTENVNSVREIDAKLTIKIDCTLSDKVNAVKEEAESRLANFSTTVDSRFEDIARKMNYLHAGNGPVVTEVASITVAEWKFQTESRLDKMERLSLSNELVITGIPFNQGENSSDIVGDIVNVLNCNFKPNDFSAIYRVPPKKNQRNRSRGNVTSTPIIIRFYFEDAKQHFMSSYFKKKGLNLADIGFKTSSRIYINESLTKLNREIFNSAAQAKRLQKLHKYFTRRGLVYVQMAPDSNTVCITSVGKFDELISEYELPVTGQNVVHTSTVTSQQQTQLVKESLNQSDMRQIHTNFEPSQYQPSTTEPTKMPVMARATIADSAMDGA
ncbi:hypothetical protein Bhyg_13239 [Pseudolycoriella hygida]|uniref:Uncharacterized protein n=1 Tax=Pseudolycoriella hygida TaxID=35572 RepID=A0A9Q0RW73_9DIPT|nr:hypothetical protein Bhyg_13239 [Pseudolycoriella hygida]